MFEAKQEDITLKQILKRGTNEKLDNFLSTTIKISSKKRLLLNSSKRKFIKEKLRSETVIISSLDNFGNEALPTIILIPITNTDVIDITMIGTGINYVASRLKGAQIFTISIKNLEFQTAKEIRPETDLKSIVSKECHNYLDIFSKKDSNTIIPHQKYDH